MHNDPNTPSPSNALEARVQKLEEALGFGEHERDQLHQQLLALMQDLRATQRKLASLEQRLDSKEASQDTTDNDRESESHEQ